MDTLCIYIFKSINQLNQAWETVAKCFHMSLPWQWPYGGTPGDNADVRPVVRSRNLPPLMSLESCHADGDKHLRY